jgi:hypothetical protein
MSHIRGSLGQTLRSASSWRVFLLVVPVFGARGFFCPVVPLCSDWGYTVAHHFLLVDVRVYRVGMYFIRISACSATCRTASGSCITHPEQL